MFDISFMEMLIVAIAALVVIGPERLPKVARQAGQWITKMRRYVDDVKSDFNRQIELSELRNLKKDVEEAARSIEGSVGGAMTDVEEFARFGPAVAGGCEGRAQQRRRRSR